MMLTRKDLEEEISALSKWRLKDEARARESKKLYWKSEDY